MPPRRRKDYRIAPSPDLLVGEPGALVVNFLDGEARLQRAFDFSVHADRPVMAAELALAFRHHHVDKSPATREGAFTHLRVWFQFLDEHATPLARMGEVDTAALRAFIAWLDGKPWTKGTRHSHWSALKQLVAWLQRRRPDLAHPDLEIPFNAFPRKNATTRPREALSRAEIEAVMAAARVDIEASWLLFQTGRAALAGVDRAAILAETDLAKLDLDDLGVLLAVIVDRFGGVIPPASVTLKRGTGLWRIHFAVLARGGARRLAPYLHATHQTLVPYMIAIGAQTYANPEGLRLMRRDCMSEHLLLGGRVVVTWAKGRSNREQRRSFLRDRSTSVPNLIDRVLAMTALLAPHALAQHRDRLFLYERLNSGRGVHLLPDYLISVEVRRFVLRHGLADATGRPLALNIAALRSTGLTLAHQALGHDIFKTQALANHATPDTTQRYIDRPQVRREQAAELSVSQARFVEVIRSGGVDATATEPETADARRATAAGFVCADPLAGVAAGQKAGRLCTAWLGCFSCPNAVIPLDAGTLAKLIATRDAIASARHIMAPDRWRLLYAPKLEILERDILPRFPPDLHVAARGRPAPILPPIE